MYVKHLTNKGPISRSPIDTCRRKNMRRKKLGASCLILIVSAIMILAGCSGGGGGGSSSSSSSSGSSSSASGLSVAEQVSVVEAQESAGKVKAMKLGKLFLSPGDVPADSQYNTDRQEVYVHERSAEAFNIINEILCSMGQSRYDEMVNSGNYKAQIDVNQCSQNKDSASSAGESSQNQSSGSTAPNYEMWTVNSSRADNSSPHIVKVWIHEKAEPKYNEPAKVIYVKVTITEGASDTNPYGIFTIYFKGHPEEGGVVDTEQTMFYGYLKAEKQEGSDDVLLSFVCQDPEETFKEQVVLNRAADGSGGSGSVSLTDEWDGDTSFDIAFNTTHFLREDVDTSDQMCFSRTTFDETAWDYGLYNSSGARVTRNSGFSIKTGEYYGWIGYYGLWLPEQASVGNGDTVYKVSFGQGGETAVPYTVIKKGGRLKKHTRNTTTLGTIKNIPLDYWSMGGSSRVKWNGSGFVTFAVMNDENHIWENIPEEALDMSALDFGELNFWSQSLGGQVRVKLANCLWNMETGKVNCDAPGNSTPVIYFKEDVVFPGDSVPASLRCYDNCPKYTAEAGGVVPADSMYAPDWNPSDGTDSHDYTFSSAVSEMLLKEDGNALVWIDDSSGQNQWGVMSGPMFNPTQANLDLLDCNWDGDNDPATDPQTCGWRTHSELSTFYTWETGANAWNQFTALRDAGGNILEFQPPLQVQYVHSQPDESASDYKYDGVSFYLEYSGFGNLHGIPGNCIDRDTGEPTNCGPGTRWVPEFTIPDGSEATDGTNDYLIKALRKEQRMSSVDLGLCSTLTVSSYTLPEISEETWVDPGIGAEPVVSNAPAVIGGEIQ